jgi:hypothetical protein
MSETFVLVAGAWHGGRLSCGVYELLPMSPGAC